MSKDFQRKIGQRKLQATLEDAAERALMLSRLLNWASEEAGRLGRYKEAGELLELSRRVSEPQPVHAGA